MDNLPISEQQRLPLTEMNWEVYLEGLYQFLNRFHFHYRPKKLYVTENGFSHLDEPDLDGKIRDRGRIDYLAEHLTSAHRAIKNGVPLAGYFVWSFMDNMEWAKGCQKRFGLVYVDFKSLERNQKDSARWYTHVIADNGFQSEQG